MANLIKENSSENSIKSKIVKELYYNKVLSCAEISQKIKKSIPIVTKIINDMVTENLLIAKGVAESSGGRRPLIFALNTTEKFLIAIAMDQYNARIAIYNELNVPLTNPEIIDLKLPNNPNALKELLDFIKTNIAKWGINVNKILGIGIGMPGFVNVKNGINYSFLSTKKNSLKEYLSQELKVPVFIDNDSSLVALAEFRFGAAKLKQNAMVINVGWGIGLGMIINGEIFRGSTGFAGEFSHMPTANGNEMCSCGKQGCLETEASLLIVCKNGIAGLKSGRVSSLTEKMLGGALNDAELAIANAANTGDQFAIELLYNAGYAIGKGLAILIHLMNPETIVLSGRGAKAGKILMVPINQALQKYAIPRLAENTEIKISNLGYDAELLGAAILIIENIEKIKSKKNAIINKL